jgi:hypothetical protein
MSCAELGHSIWPYGASSVAFTVQYYDRHRGRYRDSSTISLERGGTARDDSREQNPGRPFRIGPSRNPRCQRDSGDGELLSWLFEHQVSSDSQGAHNWPPKRLVVCSSIGRPRAGASQLKAGCKMPMNDDGGVLCQARAVLVQRVRADASQSVCRFEPVPFHFSCATFEFALERVEQNCGDFRHECHGIASIDWEPMFARTCFARNRALMSAWWRPPLCAESETRAIVRHH